MSVFLWLTEICVKVDRPPPNFVGEFRGRTWSFPKLFFRMSSLLWGFSCFVEGRTCFSEEITLLQNHAASMRRSRCSPFPGELRSSQRHQLPKTAVLKLFPRYHADLVYCDNFCTRFSKSLMKRWPLSVTASYAASWTLWVSKTRVSWGVFPKYLAFAESELAARKVPSRGDRQQYSLNWVFCAEATLERFPAATWRPSLFWLAENSETSLAQRFPVKYSIMYPC